MRMYRFIGLVWMSFWFWFFVVMLLCVVVCCSDCVLLNCFVLIKVVLIFCAAFCW